MKKTLILLAAAASFMLTGCTDSDLTGGTSFTEGSSSGAIQFSAKTGNTGMTRAGYAGDLTNASIKESSAGFGVFAYYSETQKITAWGNWDVTANPVKPINKAPNFMYNEKLTWSNTINGWDYSPVKYWPNGTDAANVVNVTNPSNTATEAAPQYLSFFAYAPYVAETTTEYEYNTTDSKIGADTDDEPGDGAILTVSDPTAVQNGIVAMSKNDAANDMYVKYILNPEADGGKFVDLTWGLRGQLTYKETDHDYNAVTTLGSEYNTDLTKQPVDEKVKFLFKHALSRVGGSTSSSTSGSGSQVCGLWAVVDVDANSTTDGTGLSNQTTYFSNDFSNAKTLVTIESVKIRDKYSYAAETDPSTTETSDFLTDGWFDIMNGTWSNTATEVTHTTGGHGATYSVTADNDPGTGEYALNADIKEGTVDNAAGADWTTTNSGGATGVTLTKKKVYADNQDVPGLLLIPGDGSNTLYITVKYHVRTADRKLSTGFSHVTQTITNKVTLDGSILNPNKYYNLVMHLGLTSVKFEAVVSDWSNGNDEYNEDGGETDPNTGEDNKSIWLPSNVVTSPQVGDIYYSDGTFSSTLETGKTPIGIIAYVGNDEYTESGNGGGHGLVLALKNAAASVQWASDDKYDTDLGMTKVTTGASVTSNISGYSNTNTIKGAGDATDYPAAYAAANYSVTAPASSTGWFLPSAAQWYQILKNLGGVTKNPLFYSDADAPRMGAAATVVDALNSAFTAKSLVSGSYDVFSADTWFWSSSEYANGSAVNVNLGSTYGVYFSDDTKGGGDDVRPVLAF